MKNFVAVGNTLTITAGADIVSGAGVLVGSLFGVAAGHIAEGAEGVINLTGVYDLPKAPSQAWTVGALIYWDEGDARCTNVASTNVPIGVAVAAVGGTAGEIVGRVRLNGAAVAATSGGG
ncbi:MAG: DUF2190 family protein [Gemmobacter sp.]|jgi:predicted RecA/RadA family phage recombinase|nr:DUF2190 family protein [Gemmobacter sp.]